MLSHWTNRKGPVTCFKCLLLHPISKRHIFDGNISPSKAAKLWHASRTSSSTLVKYNQLFITLQCHSKCFFIDYSLNTSNRLSSSSVSVQWHLKLFFTHPGSNKSTCISPPSVSLLWHAFSVSSSTPAQTYSGDNHFPCFTEEVQPHLCPPQIKQTQQLITSFFSLVSQFQVYHYQTHQ